MSENKAKELNRRKTPNSPKILVGGIADGDDVLAFLDTLSKVEHRFDTHIIAYIDFLGMKEKMTQEKSFESLQILRFLMFGTNYVAKAISNTNSIDDFNIKLFSDNVVITQQVDNKTICNQILGLVNLVMSIQFYALMQFGFWLRGAITIGELSIDNTVVWGTGLIEAYTTENQIAIFPRVVISPKIIATYKENTKATSLNLDAFVLQDDDGALFLDFLLAAPNLKLIPTISAILGEKTKEMAAKDERVRQKANWMISYFNRHCQRYKDRIESEKYILPLI